MRVYVRACVAHDAAHSTTLRLGSIRKSLIVLLFETILPAYSGLPLEEASDPVGIRVVIVVVRAVPLLVEACPLVSIQPNGSGLKTW